MWTIVCGFFVHVVFLLSIFDIYFKSPIVHGITPTKSVHKPQARRLVLFVADGLRADECYRMEGPHKPRTPFLRSVIETRGAWGVSHTRVPTESRPGTVAIAAGLYEDPSAVFKGWKENPVEFDSVFNESRYTWSWGAPDVLPMFKKGVTRDNMWSKSYRRSDIDFSDSTFNLDKWVFKKFETFIQSAKNNEKLRHKLNEDGIIFFLHLLGIDIAGHTYKPYSKQYTENIKLVDGGIREIEKILKEFYNDDGKTSFVFTADHGMSNWGAHGSGTPHETETPFVVWGAGVRGPKKLHDGDMISPESWGLNHVRRSDIHQGDIATLMATLIGIPIPVNSVGILPQDYLNFTDSDKAKAVFSNAQQLLAQYKKKRELTEEGTLPWLYWPNPDLPAHIETQMEQDITDLITQERFTEAVVLSNKLLRLCLEGLDYYQYYYKSLLLACITLSFIGWDIWLIWILLSEHSQLVSPILEGQGRLKNTEPWFARIFNRECKNINAVFIVLILVTILLIHVQSLPYQFHVYCVLPEVLWWAILCQYNSWHAVLKTLSNSVSNLLLTVVVILCLIGTEILVSSFFNRPALSIGMVGLAVWPFTSSSMCKNWKLLCAWIVSCVFMGIFPLLPVVIRDAKPQLVCIAGWIFVLLAAVFIRHPGSHLINAQRNNSASLFTTLIQVCLLPIAIWDVWSTASNFSEDSDRKTLPFINQLISWLLLGCSILLPMFGSHWILTRLLNVTVSLAASFLLLSVSHEGLFLVALTITMFCWLYLEYHTVSSSVKICDFSFDVSSSVDFSQRSLNGEDLRRAYFFLFFIILSFFGTGNIASINTFDPSWVRCFLTVFSPFTMSALILWKIVIPFLIVTCTFRAINIVVQAPTGSLFLIILIFCDMMGLHFFYLVTNKGSWLDIGTSISHYVIVQTIVLFIVVMHGVAKIMTSASLWPLVRNLEKKFKKKPKVLKYQTLESGDDVPCQIDHSWTISSNSLSQRKRHVE